VTLPYHDPDVIATREANAALIATAPDMHAELAELRTLLTGVPGDTLAEQVRTLLRDRNRLEWLDKAACADRALRDAIDAAMRICRFDDEDDDDGMSHERAT
jgi:hypothetical protein